MATNLTGSKIKDTYSQLLHIDGGPTSLEKTVLSATGVSTALKLGTASVSVGNLRLSGNTLSSIDTNGNVVLAPNGTGLVAVGNLRFSGNTISTANVNGNLILAPDGTGTVNIANANITGGTIGGAVSFAGGSFTSITLVSATTITGVTTTNGGNLRLSGNTLSSTDTNGNVLLTPNGTGKVLATKAFGYGGTGTGGTVTQATSRTTGVTLDKLTGEIVLVAGTISGHEADEFTLTNSTIEANDVVVVCIKSGCAAGTRKYYQVHVVAVSAGSCVISVGNIDNATIPSSSTDSPVIQFAVLKGAVA